MQKYNGSKEMRITNTMMIKGRNISASTVEQTFFPPTLVPIMNFPGDISHLFAETAGRSTITLTFFFQAKSKNFMLSTLSRYYFQIEGNL